MPKVTASPHITATPQPSMALAKTAAATAPSPTRMRTKVPTNSARHAPASGAASMALVGCSVASAVPAAAAAFDMNDSSQILFHEFQDAPLGAARERRPGGAQDRRGARRVLLVPAVRPTRQVPHQVGPRYAAFLIFFRRRLAVVGRGVVIDERVFGC